MECTKCGGRGGDLAWPGFTCWRCGGSGKMEARIVIKRQANPDLVRMMRHGKVELYAHIPTGSYVIFKGGIEIAHETEYKAAERTYSANW